MRNQNRIYSNLFINNVALADVRAPIEYERGAFPNAENLPIMDNHQREIIGTCYTNYGREKAIRKGHELVRDELKEMRVNSWIKFADRNPGGFLYCFRGGLRSQIAQQWMQEAGVDFPVIKGGYKALRTFLLHRLEKSINQCNFTLVGGKTGCGKTILIKNLENGIDMEAAAHHRGSSFGRHTGPQNNQINFENILSIEFLKLGRRDIIVEDEARTIGKVGIPKILFEKMRQSPLVVIEEPYEQRLQNLMQEYVIDMCTEFTNLYGQHDGFASFSSYLIQSLDKIHKRLGPARYGDTRKNMQQALNTQMKTGETIKHYDWLVTILDNYYDPMYEDQLNQRKNHICFRGNYEACREYLRTKPSTDKRVIHSHS